MTLFINISKPATTGIINHITDVIRDRVAMVLIWRKAMITRRELYKLSERELADIGLNRGDIDAMTH